jgi:hypothetical protein
MEACSFVYIEVVNKPVNILSAGMRRMTDANCSSRDTPGTGNGMLQYPVQEEIEAPTYAADFNVMESAGTEGNGRYVLRPVYEALD